MPVVDYGNKLKVAGIQKINAAKKKFSREVLTNTGKNAGKLTAINKITLPQLIEKSLEEVNEAIENGNFHAFISANKKFAGKVADYYQKKGYMVFLNDIDSSDNDDYGSFGRRFRGYGGGGNILVCWIGCKNWIKARELNGSNKTKLVNEMYSEIKRIIHDEWGEDKKSCNLKKVNMPLDFMDNEKSAKNTLARFMNRI